MSTQQVSPRRAVTAALFDWLGDVPWWVVIVAIIGLVVAFSVLTDIRYLDAIYFLFDLPWNKALVAEVPVEDTSWQFSPDAKAALAPRIYRLYAEFDKVQGTVAGQSALYAEPTSDSAESAQLSGNEALVVARWKTIPGQTEGTEQRWAYVLAEDGRAGWIVARQLTRLTYQPVGKSGLYAFEVPKNAAPVAEAPIESPTGTVIRVGTSTPAIGGPVTTGSWVRVYERYVFGQMVSRAWNSKGVMLTLRATVLGYALALTLGLLAGLMLVSRNPLTLAVSKLYVEVIRGIPLLVIILYAGFVLSPYLREATGGSVDLRGFPGAVIGLGFGYGAYLAEVFRAGIQSIHRGQMEAARSLGMSYFQAMRYVILPQAIRVVLPPLGNDFIAMLKDSSLISVVALPEILQQGRLWVSRTFRAFEGYNTVALFYLVMTLLLSLLVRLIEHKTALPGRSED